MPKRLFIDEMARMAGAVLNKKPLRQARNAVKNVADRIALTTPLSRTERDAIAILNPSLGLKPTRTRGEYRQAARINDFDPVRSYQGKRKERIATAFATGALAGAGAKLYSDAKQRTDAERNRIARESQAQQEKAYQQRYEANRNFNTRIKQQWQDEAFGYNKELGYDTGFRLKNPVSGGTAVAAALQDVQQKIKNRIHPNKDMYVTEYGAIRPASERVKSAIQDPFNAENVYNFNSMMANIPQDSTDEYTMVASSGAGKPVARITATSNRPKVTVNTSLLDTMRNKPDVKNMSLAELQDFAETFNSFMGTQPGNRFQTLEFLNPVKPSSSRGSATTKRMTKGEQMTNNTTTKRLIRPKLIGSSYLDMRFKQRISGRTGLSTEKPMTRKTNKYGTTVRKADSQRNPAYVRLPKAPATSDANTRRLAQRNRIRSAVDAFMENPGRAMLNTITPERTKVRRLQEDMLATYMKNPEFYNKIRQGYFDAKGKGYIRGKNMPTR